MPPNFSKIVKQKERECSLWTNRKQFKDLAWKNAQYFLLWIKFNWTIDKLNFFNFLFTFTAWANDNRDSLSVTALKLKTWIYTNYI
jgi:hypothetical protein